MLIYPRHSHSRIGLVIDEISVVAAENSRRQLEMKTEMENRFVLQNEQVSQVSGSQQRLDKQFQNAQLRVGHEFEYQRRLLGGLSNGQEELASRIEGTEQRLSTIIRSQQSTMQDFMQAMLEIQRYIAHPKFFST